MKRRKDVSRLSEHRLHKKQGIVATPLNDRLRDQLTLSSWGKERMPEYLWLGLILLYYGREEGLEKAGRVLLDISKKVHNLPHPRLSMVFGLSDEDQHTLFTIVSTIIDKKVLSPLTVLYRPLTYPVFNDFFNIPQFGFESRIKYLLRAIEIYFSSGSDETTDLRFLSLSFLIFSDKLRVAKGLTMTIEALKEYPYTEHSDEKMRKYRPAIRSMEGGYSGTLENNNNDFCKQFWIDIGMITSCKPVSIVFDQNKYTYKDFIRQFQKTLEYIIHSNKEKSLAEDKFDVIVGSITYALKIFIELTEKSLGNSILGRHGVRTIIEILIILKYLLKREVSNHDIWEEYKLYGISKYKLILLKARETDLDNTAHFIPLIVDALVNEIRWEEFIDVDLKYFDKHGIREKSIEADEKELFDLFYDYDSSFAHGLWGAVRESAMVHCDNAAHQYHAIPDINSNQELPDVKADSFKTMQKLLSLLTGIYNVPKELKNGYSIS
ncbi:hypothetical protein GCAAIG_09465 [Candidatus Electronema halotolerans]